MLARCSLATFALVLGLTCPVMGQETGGKLSIPDSVLEGLDTADGASSNAQSSVTEMKASPEYWGSEEGTSSYRTTGSLVPSLGPHLRARYSTQSYGQPDGNFELGTMLMDHDADTSWFLDGQVTMNDESGVGFDLGAGFRTLTNSDYLGEKLVGLSLWADGTSTINDNFFPQVGLSYELLGDQWDMRANAAFVVSDRTQTGDTVIVGGLGFLANNLVQSSTTGIDNAMHSTDIELARRIADRELWGFAGAYGLYGDGVDTAGYKLGVRGYALPDLALSVSVADDDLFHTNTIFSLTWFIGRTRTNTPVTCDLRERFRDPVLRNNYVPVYQDQVAGGGALTNDFDGDGTAEDIRFVHIDSNSAAGGDGSFENPFNSLDAAEAAGTSLANDVILVHGGTTYNNQTGLTLLDGQRLLGEGDNMTFTIATDQFGTLTIPETSAGAQALAAPVVNLAAGATGVTLADSNEVANLDFAGGLTAIAAGVNGSGDPNLHDLSIDGATGNAILLAPLERVDGANTTIAFNAMLNNITFNNVGGSDINIDGTTISNPADANVTLNESITISNITSTNSNGTSLLVANTNNGGSLAVDNYNWDGGATGLIGMQLTSNAGTVDVTNSTLTGGAAGAVGFDITNNTGTVAIGTSSTVTDINGTAANITGNSASVDFAANVSNTTVAGGTVTIDSNTAAVTLNGDITTEDATSVLITDALADVVVNGSITRNGVAGQAIDITDNVAGDGGSIQFNTLTSTVTSNDGSQAFRITGGDDNVTVLADVVDTGGILVQNRTGGTVDFGGNVATSTDTNDAVRLVNIDTTQVNFMNLDITTTTGVAFTADSGDVNVTGTSSSITTGATSGGLVLNGTLANPITSTNGITFASIDTAAGSTNAIFLDHVEGNVTVNGGVLNTNDTSVQVNNATGLTLNSVDMNSTSGDAVVATYDHDQSNNLSVSGADLNGGNVTVLTSTATPGANTVATISTSTEAGAFDFDTTGAGNLSASLTTVTGTGAVTLDVSGNGDGSLTTNGLNTGQTVDVNSTAGAGGNLTLAMTNSGNTTPFGAITFNDQGDGNGSASLTNVESTAGVDFDSSGDGTANLSISGGTYAGGVTADASNNGTFTHSITNGADITGAVAVNATNAGTFTSTVVGANNFGNTLDINASNTGAATLLVDGGDYADTVTITGGNTEDFDLTFQNTDVNSGASALSLDLQVNNTVDNANVTMMNNNFESGVNIIANNNINLDLRIDNDTVITGSDDVAFALTVGASVNTGDILISNSDYTTNNAIAFDFDKALGSGTVDFQLDGNNFTNSSAAAAAADINVLGGTMNTTIGVASTSGSGNTFTSGSNLSDQLVVTADGATATVNLLLEGNTANSGNGNLNLVEANGAAFNLFNSVNVNAQTQNTGTVTFDPNFAAFDDLANEPQRP